MTIFLITIFTALFIWLASKNLERAVLLLAFLLPVYLLRFTVVIPFTLLEIMILVVFVVWFWQSRAWLWPRLKSLPNKNISVTAYPFAWPLAAWLIVSLIAVGVSGFSLAAFGLWRAYFFEPALLYIVIVNVINTKEKIIKLLVALGMSASIIALFALYQYLSGNFITNPLWASVAGRRATSFFQYPNAVGLYVAPIAMLAVGALGMILARGKAVWKERIDAMFWLKVIVLSLIAIFCAHSEGAGLGITAGLIIFGLCANKKLRLFTLSVIVVAGIAIAAVPKIQHYASDTIFLRSFSGQVRRAQWHETWSMLKDGRLLFGAGLNGYQKALAPYHVPGIFVKDYNDPNFQRKVVYNEAFHNKVWQPLEIYLYPHNILLNFWTETGVPGVLVFMWIIVLYFYYGIRSYREALRMNDPFAYVILGLISALAGWLVHGLVDVPYFKNDLAAMFWVMMGLMSVIYVMNKKQLELK